MQYSIVVPIYSDGYLAPALCDEIERVMSAYVGATPLHQVLELIFVNDGSKDESLQTLLELPSVSSTSRETLDNTRRLLAESARPGARWFCA